MTIVDIRKRLVDLYNEKDYVIDKTGVQTLEIINASFIADDVSIFGAVNYNYIGRELEWYNSMSLNVNDIPGPTPKIWESVADDNGWINSNYGYLAYNKENGDQFNNCVKELRANRYSRRAVMVYNRPTIWSEYNANGMSDFICTNAVQYLIRNDKLEVVVQMRSNDAWAGYRNDYAWQKITAERMAASLEVDLGNIHWNVGSLHLYESQFYLLDHYIKTGDHNITYKEYLEKNESGI